MLSVWLRTLQLSVKSLLMHPLRSSLTVLGIFIGVSSVIWLLALGEGISQAAQEQISSLGANILQIRPGQGFGRGGGGAQSPDFSMDDVEAIQEQVAGVRAVAPQAQASALAVRNAANWQTTIAGTTAQFFVAQQWALTDGRIEAAMVPLASSWDVIAGLCIAQEAGGLASRWTDGGFPLTGTRATGACAAKGGSMHITRIDKGMLGSYAIVGAHLPIAAGAAWSAKLRGTDQVAVAFFGDGATNIGAFHEALNLAAVWRLPVVFVCENNFYMEYTPIATVTSVTNPAADRAGAHRIPAEVIDGNDVVVVYDALTTTRSYRGAMSHEEALAQMEESRHWWRPDVYAAFLRSVGSAPQPV